MMPPWEFAALTALVMAASGSVVVWTTTGLVWPVLAALGATALYMGALEIRDRRRLARARAALEALGAWPPGALREIPPAPLFQEDYAKILRDDRARFDGEFEWRVGTFRCRRCHRRADLVSVHHPIWDGPFDGAGSGAVDVRDVPWCLGCDGLGVKFLASVGVSEPLPVGGRDWPGRPVRLPFLDIVPVRLLPELYDRPAFHLLMIGVERYVPPAVNAASEEGAPPAIGPHAPRDRVWNRDRGDVCGFCREPVEAPIHQVED